MEIINWSFLTTNEINGVEHPDCILPLISNDYVPFKSLSKEIAISRKGSTYLKCPAHTDFIKNTFVFCAPFDLTIDLEINIKTKSIKIYCENISQEIFERIIDTRFLFNIEKETNTCPVIGIDWLSVFTSASLINMQVMPAFMHHNDFTKKTTIIPGEYNIGQWTRPVEVVFEVNSLKEKIVIKKGDAISYVKFLTDNPLKLKKSSVPWKEIQDCDNIRSTNKFRPLKERYKSLEKVRASECPYNHTK
jgi:hypothetical protein